MQRAAPVEPAWLELPVTERLRRLGGTATWLEMVGGPDATPRSRSRTSRDLAAAVSAGTVVRLAKGRYAVPAATEVAQQAAAHSGVAMGLSAAVHHGLKVKDLPDRLHLAVPRGRRFDSATAQRLRLTTRDLASLDTVGRVTSLTQTVLDCAAYLPFDAALTVADSALRQRLVTPAQLVAAAERLPPKGRARIRRVLVTTRAGAANPFESVLRAVVLDVGRLRVVPQVWVSLPGGRVRVDLLDPWLGIVLEADSWEFHATPSAFRSDCRRYTELVATGRTVLRFG